MQSRRRFEHSHAASTASVRPRAGYRSTLLKRPLLFLDSMYNCCDSDTLFILDVVILVNRRCIYRMLICRFKETAQSLEDEISKISTQHIIWAPMLYQYWWKFQQPLWISWLEVKERRRRTWSLWIQCTTTCVLRSPCSGYDSCSCALPLVE